MSQNANMVTHPKHGRGRLLRKAMGGYMWEVQFESGKRFRLAFHEFESSSIKEHSPVIEPFTSPLKNTLSAEQYQNRQTMEALRVGVVPVQNVKDLTMGLETEKTAMGRAIKRTREHGGDVIAVIADYGFGKSHFIELTAQTALENNFLVANASLDLVEVPPAKAREIYRALTASIRYPGESSIFPRGLGPLLEMALQHPAAIARLQAKKPIEDCPLCAVLSALQDCPNQSAREDLVNWLGAQIKTTANMKTCLKRPPTLYATGEVARQYAYLLTALSVLAVEVGYAGLAVLIDESEHYSLLRPSQRERADSFFKAMILAASTDNPRIHAESIPNHTRVDYPLKFSRNAHLLFMFASTESDSGMPIDSWLAPTQVTRLDNRFLKEDIQKFVRMVLRYHSVAYSYKPARERYENLLIAIAGTLSQTLNQHQINIRQLIRLTVNICDLMFLYPDYDPNTIESELGKGLSHGMNAI